MPPSSGFVLSVGGNCCPPLFWQTLQAYPFAILCRCLLLFWLLRSVALLGRGLCSPLALLCGVPSVYPRSLFWYDTSKGNVMFAACLGMPFRLSSGGYYLAHGAHYSITFLLCWFRGLVPDRGMMQFGSKSFSARSPPVRGSGSGVLCGFLYPPEVKRGSLSECKTFCLPSSKKA